MCGISFFSNFLFVTHCCGGERLFARPAPLRRLGSSRLGSVPGPRLAPTAFRGRFRGFWLTGAENLSTDLLGRGGKSSGGGKWGDPVGRAKAQPGKRRRGCPVAVGKEGAFSFYSI